MTFPPNLKSDLSFAEIKKTYKQLIEYLDNVMEHSPHRDEWRSCRAFSD